MKIDGGAAGPAPCRGPRPRPARAATPAPTAPGSCPGTRRRAGGGSAPRAGIGSGRTRPSARAAPSVRHSASGKSTTACAASVRRYCASAIANSRHTPRESTTFRSRRKRARSVSDPRREPRRPIAVAPPRIGAYRSPRAVAPSGARLAPLREEVITQAVDNAARRGGRPSAAAVAGGSQDDARVSAASSAKRGWSRGPSARNAASPPSTDASVRASRAAARRQTPSGLRSARAADEEPPEHLARDQPAVEQHARPSRSRRLPELREHQPHRRIVARACRGRRAARDRAPRRRAASTSVSSAMREAGIEIGLERELAQQRQAERVDGADRDVAEAVAQLPPSRRVDLARPRRRAAGRARCARASRRRPCA